MDLSANGLASTFIKKHLKIEKDLENKIVELEEELKKIKNSSDDIDYFLYKDILNLIIPNLKFEYDGENGGYIIKIDPPLHMPNEFIEEILKDIKKYKEKQI
jgi:hypothetical protein